MRNMFLNILDQYSAATLSSFKNNQLAEYIRTDTKKIIEAFS